MNSDWTPAAILPNLSAKKAVDGEAIALAPCHDPRVQAFCTAHANFNEFISRFTSAFEVPLNPVVLIVRDDVLPKVAQVEPLASFRDLVALSVIPYARSLGIVYSDGHRISYSNSFWLYPWMLSTNNEHLVASTPALNGLHVVEKFHGQSSPELSIMKLIEVDQPLFEALLGHWKRHYLGNRRRWQDRALFRSLNMAAQAAQLPAGIDATLYDLGRIISLWVSASEILAHPRIGRSGLHPVYSLLEQVSYVERSVAERRFVAYKSKSQRRVLPCWLYGKLYQARCDFLHGNPVRKDRLNFTGAEASLFWIAPCLYRLAVTGFLKLPPMQAPPGRFFTDPQSIIERALLRARKRK
ncbi:MAG: hypothetical protein ACLQU1_00460 [Bryobacteraceae bacterium]